MKALKRLKATYVYTGIVYAIYMVANAGLYACSSCTNKTTRVKLDAYLASTALLAFMPFILGGIFGIIYYRKYRARQNS